MTKPIKDNKKIKLILNYLKNKNLRNYLIFKLQLKTALRIGDILKLEVSNIANDGEIKTKEQKTGKTKIVLLDSQTQTEINEFIKNNNIDKFLFVGRKKTNKPITRIQAFRIIQAVGKILNIGKLATHTFRKTTAYFLYKKTNNISLVMKLLNHSSESITLLYLGITQDKINNELNNLFNY